MVNISLADWHTFLDHGRKYMRTAHRGTLRPEKFTNDLIMQLAAMGIENLLVGLWQFFGHLPEDHTLSGLVDGMMAFCPLPDSLADGIKAIEDMDDLCALVPVNHRTPSNNDIAVLLETGEGLLRFTDQRLAEQARAS